MELNEKQKELFKNVNYKNFIKGLLHQAIEPVLEIPMAEWALRSYFAESYPDFIPFLDKHIQKNGDDEDLPKVCAILIRESEETMRKMIDSIRENQLLMFMPEAYFDGLVELEEFVNFFRKLQ